MHFEKTSPCRRVFRLRFAARLSPSRADGREEEPSSAAEPPNLESGEVELPGNADFAAFVERAV